jgi:hypothetical protein
MSFVLECSIRASIIVAAGLIASWLMQRASAAARHSLLAAAMFCAAVLPIVVIGAPKWHLRVLPPVVRYGPTVEAGQSPPWQRNICLN